MAQPAISIGELSRQTGCNIETIRFYERIGLLPKARRSGRFRSYEPEDVARLGFARRARELGFTLDQVRALLGLAQGGGAACEAARDLAALHLKEVRKRVADLRRMERVLAGAIRACASGKPSGCPLIESLSAAPG